MLRKKESSRREMAARLRKKQSITDAGGPVKRHAAEGEEIRWRRYRPPLAMLNSGGSPAARTCFSHLLPQGKKAAPRRAQSSAQPFIRFMFCTAWPDAPLVTLSIADMTITRPVR